MKLIEAIKASLKLSSSWPFTYISFYSFACLGLPRQIITPPCLLRIPYNFYIVVNCHRTTATTLSSAGMTMLFLLFDDNWQQDNFFSQKIAFIFFQKTEPALLYDSVYTLALGLQALGRSTSLSIADLSCVREEPWSDGSSLFNYINAVSREIHSYSC